jgi:hypothetical protein
MWCESNFPCKNINFVLFNHVSLYGRNTIASNREQFFTAVSEAKARSYESESEFTRCFLPQIDGFVSHGGEGSSHSHMRKTVEFALTPAEKRSQRRRFSVT